MGLLIVVVASSGCATPTPNAVEATASTPAGPVSVQVPDGFREVVPPLGDSHLSLLSEGGEASFRAYVVPAEGRGSLQQYADWWVGRIRDRAVSFAAVDERTDTWEDRGVIQVVARYRSSADGPELVSQLSFIDAGDHLLYSIGFAAPEHFEAFRERLGEAARTMR